MKLKGSYQKIKGNFKLVEAAIINKNAGYLGYTDINVAKKFPYKKDFVIKFDIEINKMYKSGAIEKIIEQFVN